MIMRFLTSYPGMYLAQSVLHSFVALIVVELSFFAWGIRDHQSKFRYRILTLALPLFMFPLYQLLDPQRSSWYFRLQTALFDSQRWLELDPLGFLPLSAVFLLFLTSVSAVFVVQEILPLFRERSSRDDLGTCEETLTSLDALLKNICQSVQIEKPSICVIDESLPILVTQGFRNHSITISSHLIETLDEEQLKGALTHETVHIKRDSSTKTQLIYLLRMLMFYNPVSLVEFRRLVRDDEFICDAITVSKTENPAALAAAISSFYYTPPEREGPQGLLQMKERIENHSHNLLLDERIQKLQETEDAEPVRFGWLQFMLTASVILLMGYLVV
jgi:Zn-dependent protease with chaperone function